MTWDAVRFCRDFSIPFVSPGMSQSGKVSQGWIGLQCPNPTCERNTLPDYGGFNIPGGYYACWNCGGHSLLQVIRWLLKIGNYEAQQLIWDYSGTSSVLASLNTNKKQAKAKKIELPGEDLNKYHKIYLRERGFDPNYLIKKYNLQGVGGNPKGLLDKGYRNRVIIPIYDRNGRLVSYQGRDITGEARIRYKGCTIEDSVLNYKHTLYGWPGAVDGKAAFVEGVIDQWAMGDGFLATFGTAVTEQQIREMSYFERSFFLFDPEKNAQELAQKHAYKLASIGRKVEVIEMDEGFDPGELPEDDIKYIRRELGFL